MHDGRSLVAYAHVRTVMIIEMYIPSYHISGMGDVIEVPLPVDTFTLDYPVDPFGDGIVRRVIVFRHADVNVMLPQHCHISVAAVLYTPVGVVHQPFEAPASGHFDGLCYSLLQSLYGDCGPERIGKYPADNLSGVGICNQVEIAYVSVSQ